MTAKITIITSSGTRHEVTIHERTEDTMTISLDGLPTTGTITHRLRRLIDGRWADDAGNIVSLSESHVDQPAVDYDPETGMLTVTMEHPPMEATVEAQVERVDEQPRGHRYLMVPGHAVTVRCLCGECHGEPLQYLRESALDMVHEAAAGFLDDQARLADMHEAQERVRQAL